MKRNIILLTFLSLFVWGCGSSNNISSNSESASESLVSESSEIMCNKTLEMTYTFTGNGINNPGNGQGIIEITPLGNAKNLGYYVIYLANDNEIIAGLDEFASIKSTGNKVTIEIKDGIYLPNEATRLIAFESTMSFFDDIPDITTANAICNIKDKEDVFLGNLQFKFAAASDVHMNYQDYNRGAIEKWEKALNFFYENNAEYVIVTGDMTGDDALDYEYQTYVDIINKSPIDFNNVFECIGNHGNTPAKINLMNQYLKGTKQIHPKENSPYYHVLIEGKDESCKDNLFIFMQQELLAPGDTAKYDNFSKEQIDWLESLLVQYSNTNTNIFLIEHSPFLNFGAGDRNPSGYGGLLKLNSSYTQTLRFKSLLETYKNVIMMSGHTHLTFYDGQNYSNVNGTFAHTVHISSTCQPNSYNEEGKYVRNTDGRYEVTPTYGSEAYLVEVYDNYIFFKGYNLVTKKLIPSACFLIEI